ncbi:hypothetical protein [Promicromonospora soli]
MLLLLLLFLLLLERGLPLLELRRELAGSCSRAATSSRCFSTWARSDSISARCSSICDWMFCASVIAWFASACCPAVMTTPTITPRARPATAMAIMRPAPGGRRRPVPAGRGPAGAIPTGPGPAGMGPRGSGRLTSSMLNGPGPGRGPAGGVEPLPPRPLRAASTPVVGFFRVASGGGGGGVVPGAGG